MVDDADTDGSADTDDLAGGTGGGFCAVPDLRTSQ